MSNHQKIAIGTLRHYLETAYTAAGLTWEYDNTSEVENIVDAIVSAAVDEVMHRQPQRDPDQPTGPTLQHVRELEAEVLATATERNALRDRLNSLAALIEGIADDDAECPFCMVVGDRDHRPNCLVNVARAAAANEAQS